MLETIEGMQAAAAAGSAGREVDPSETSPTDEPTEKLDQQSLAGEVEALKEQLAGAMEQGTRTAAEAAEVRTAATAAVQATAELQHENQMLNQQVGPCCS